MHSQSLLFVLLCAARRAVPAGSSTGSCSTVPVQPQALLPACSWAWHCGIATVISYSPSSPCLYCTWPRRGTGDESCPSCFLLPTPQNCHYPELSRNSLSLTALRRCWQLLYQCFRSTPISSLCATSPTAQQSAAPQQLSKNTSYPRVNLWQNHPTSVGSLGRWEGDPGL